MWPRMMATEYKYSVLWFIQKCYVYFAEPPSELRVVNITHRAVQLEWLPGFHGGMEQYFRLRYKQTTSHETSSSDDLFRFWDVYPANANSAVISDLDPGMEYEIDVMSMNDLGESNFTTDPVIVRTSSEWKLIIMSRIYHIRKYARGPARRPDDDGPPHSRGRGHIRGLW